ncbi:MAG: hypothetical protein WCD86_17200, partial [Ktedonobacteraceae bacterium]
TEHTCKSLKGSCYLLAAEVNAFYTEKDEKLRTKCRRWQDQAANLLYKGKIEEDETFLWFNLYAVHHERAKTLARFSLFHVNDNELLEHLKGKFVHVEKRFLEDAHEALAIAKKHLDQDSIHQTATMDYTFTEARIFLIGKEFEESAKVAKRALKIAHAIHSQQGIEQVRKVYAMLYELEPKNPYVRNLAVELGIY